MMCVIGKRDGEERIELNIWEVTLGGFCDWMGECEKERESRVFMIGRLQSVQ